MRSLKLMIVGISIVTLAAGVSRGQTTPIAREGASFVFLGTVTKAQLGGTREPARAIRVERVYFQRGTFDIKEGSIVIVTGRTVPSKGRHVFHVEPYQFGTRVQAELVLAEARKQYTDDEVNRLKRAKRKEEVSKRVKGAGLILIGSVESIREWGDRDRTESEHDPRLTWVVVTVSETLRGRASESRQEFLFAASDDVHWYRSPKPRTGLRAAFLLRKGFEGLEPAVAEAWTLLHADDLLEGADIEILREILREGGAE